MSVYQLTTRGVFLGQAVRNMYMFYHPSMTALMLQDTWDAFAGYWEETIKLVASNQYTIPEYSWRRVDAAGFPEVPTLLETPLIGNGVGDVTASQMAVAATLYTGTQAPNRGRKFFGGFNEAGMTNGRWLESVTDACGSFIGNIIGMNGGDPGVYPELVIGRWVTQAPGGTPIPPYIGFYNPVIRFTVSDNPSALHSRRLGVGI